MGKIIEEIIDTNVIIRFLVGDNIDQHKKTIEIFKQAQQGKRKIRIKLLIIAEVCFVLESFYKKSREEIAKAFEILLSQKWLLVDERNILLSLWVYYRNNNHFVDSYLLASVKNHQTKLISFDKKLIKLSNNL